MKTMDHQEAVKMLAAERYLLKELSPEDRDGFEEHYFTCTQCANEVRAAFTFAGNAKAVMTDWRPHPVVTRPALDWWAWLKPAFAAPAAAALLLGVTGYLWLLVIPRLERDLETATAPSAFPTVVARAPTRGEDAVVQLSPEDLTFYLNLDITTDVPVSFRVYDESGSLRFDVPETVPLEGASLNLRLPAAGMQPGRYTIKVRPGGADSRSETQDDYSFVVQRK